MQTKNWLSAVRLIFLQHDSLQDKKTHFAFVIKHLQSIKPVFMKYEYTADILLIESKIKAGRAKRDKLLVQIFIS